MQSYWDNHPKNFLPYENIGAVFELTIREWLLAQGVRATNKEIFEAHKLFLKKMAKNQIWNSFVRHLARWLFWSQQTSCNFYQTTNNQRTKDLGKWLLFEYVYENSRNNILKLYLLCLLLHNLEPNQSGSFKYPEQQNRDRNPEPDKDKTQTLQN